MRFYVSFNETTDLFHVIDSTDDDVVAAFDYESDAWEYTDRINNDWTK